MPAGWSLSGDSGHGKNQGAGFTAGRVAPTARRMRPIALESAANLGRTDSESPAGRAGSDRSTSAGAGSMTVVESEAALLGAGLLGGATTGLSAAGLDPIVAGANAGPGVVTIGAAVLPSAGGVARDAVTRGTFTRGGCDLDGATGAGTTAAGALAGALAAALPMESSRGAANVAATPGRADVRITRKVQATMTEATTISCTIRLPPERARAGEACATGASAGVTSG